MTEATICDTCKGSKRLIHNGSDLVPGPPDAPVTGRAVTEMQGWVCDVSEVVPCHDCVRGADMSDLLSKAQSAGISAQEIEAF